jgi:hypothetical protein
VEQHPGKQDGAVRNINQNLNPVQVRAETVSPEDSNCSRPEYVSRATRYAIQMPIRFREGGTAEWREGVTVNISRTGILFQSEVNLPPRTLLEMQVILPFEIVGEPKANVLCWGPVVRKDSSLDESGRYALATAILRYRFSHD